MGNKINMQNRLKRPSETNDVNGIVPMILDIKWHNKNLPIIIADEKNFPVLVIFNNLQETP